MHSPPKWTGNVFNNWTTINYVLIGWMVYYNTGTSQAWSSVCDQRAVASIIISCSRIYVCVYAALYIGGVAAVQPYRCAVV